MKVKHGQTEKGARGRSGCHGCAVCVEGKGMPDSLPGLSGVPAVGEQFTIPCRNKETILLFSCNKLLPLPSSTARLPLRQGCAARALHPMRDHDDGRHGHMMEIR